MDALRRALLPLSLVAAPLGATVPLSVAQTGHVTVPVTVNGRGPFAFVIDSGAETTALYARFVAAQTLAAAASGATLVGQTGTTSVPLVPLREVVVDGHVARGIEAVQLDDRKDGVPLDGILGLDVLGDRTVDFDFRGKRVTITPGRRGAAPKGAITATRVTGGLLAIPVEVNGARGLAVVDTGARETRVNGRFARAAGLRGGTGPKTTVYGATNNAIELVAAQARTVSFGGVALRDTPIRIADLPVFAQFGIADRPAMLLGADYLADQRMIVDFVTGTIRFE